ncbi:MAG: carbohydrate-binding family V/XII [Gemmatimonadota bacterium]|nr:carbohydrate-binding family V/XII [Gemmatimonadota bacterium]
MDTTWPGVRAIRAVAVAAFGVAAFVRVGAAQEPDASQEQLVEWPQEITATEGTIVVYQPQPERLTGNVLSGRAAMALELDDREDPVFGAFFFDARLSNGSDEQRLLVRDFDVTRVSWPDATDEGRRRFTEIVEEALTTAGLEIYRDRLAASLAAADLEQESLDLIRNEPPVIVFRERLAVLLMYDGEPRFSPIENSDYQRVLNTPFLVVRRGDDGPCYLTDGNWWYQAEGPLGPWSHTTSPPADLVAMLPDAEEEAPAFPSPPEIVVATEPTELIVSDGDPAWQVLSDGDLMYVENTETPWLRQVSTNRMYLLLSGRWFRSTSEDGPWEFVRADQLPAAFDDIPPGSEIGGIRTSIAGTEEANDALLDAQVPEMAAIDRNNASLSVEYDGEPRFEAIPDTEVSYAVNTGAQVLEIDGRYYAVDEGVWFTSTSPTGPWAVADEVPEDKIAEIPPSSPVYNVTHVHVYESTPEVVYVGYTPGYMWSFPYYGVPIYGTGWYYPPYWGGGYYYPRPPTWGFHIGYNPWTGWNFGLSWSNGFFTFGISFGGGWYGGYRPWGCCGGWYGGGYRGPVFINNGDINIGNNVGLGNRDQVRDRMQDRGRPGASDRASVYDRAANRDRNASPSVTPRDLQRARPATGRANDTFADRNGNVARRTNDGWQTRENGRWGATQPATGDRGVTRPSAGQRPTTGARPDFGDLNRHQAARQSGNRRAASRGGIRRGGGRRPIDDAPDGGL